MSRRRTILIVVGIVLSVAMLIAVLHHRLRATTEAYIAELTAKGEPMALAEVIPPRIPPEQNSAPLFLKATALFDTNWNLLGSNPPPAMRMVAPGKAMIGWAQPDIRTEDGSNSWEEVEAALAEDGEAFKLLSQIGDHPKLDFDLHYRDGFDKLRLPHLPALKRSAQRLSAEAMDDLHRGDTASARKAISTTLALVNGVAHDRTIISELVRIAMAQIASSDVWEMLQSTNATDEQLAALQHDWTNLEFIRGCEHALALERVLGEITIGKWRSSGSELQHHFDLMENFTDPGHQDTVFDKFKIRIKVLMWRYWWSYPDELCRLKGEQAILEAARSAETNYSYLKARLELEDKVQKLYPATNEDVGWFGNPKDMDMRFMVSSSLPALSALFNKVMRVEAARQVVVTAIALKRYQLKHGSYPADLISLVPEFVPSVPLDPVDAEPLRYRPNATGTYLLYSIGENGVDDGGNPSLESGIKSSRFFWLDDRALDWVWPLPATAEEVQAYYKRVASKSN
jgi:hypothetical protein